MTEATEECWVGDGGPRVDDGLSTGDRNLRDLVVDAIVAASARAREVDEARELRRRAVDEVARLDRAIVDLEIAASAARGQQEGLWSVVLSGRDDMTVREAFEVDVLGIKSALESRREEANGS